MDPDEAYRLLNEAMDRLKDALRSQMIPMDLRERIVAGVSSWETLDGWMRKSGFPPTAWNNPATGFHQGRALIAERTRAQIRQDGPRDAVLPRPHGEVVGGRYTPVRRGAARAPEPDDGGIFSLLREEREQQVLRASLSRKPLCGLPIGDGSGSCGLDAGHEGRCEW